MVLLRIALPTPLRHTVRPTDARANNWPARDDLDCTSLPRDLLGRAVQGV
jgi:hypothetical protein